IFFLIGAPLGAIIRKGGLGMPIVISVSFFVIYYIITMTGEKLVNDGAWHPIAGMWLSSFILAPLALFLTYKSTTDSPLMDSETYLNKYKKYKALVLKLYNKIHKNGNTK
ncbi:MAG: LptF/LptG family permease, partial [Rikenellaceae bacterium]